MPTRIYFPSSGNAAVTPTTWQFAGQINPLTFKGKLYPSGTAMTSKTEATGVVSPTLRAMLRYVVGPIKAATINGTVRGQIGGSESNAAANANPALAVKVIQPDGTDRGTLLAPSASDSATVGWEFATALTNSRFSSATEVLTIPLTQQAAQDGDYLVVEVGFRSATTTTRNITLRYGDGAASDLPEDAATQADLNPWIEFSSTVELLVSLPVTRVTILGGSACAGGEHFTVETNFGNFMTSASAIQEAIPGTFDERKEGFVNDVRILYWKNRSLGMNHQQALSSLIGKEVWL